MIKFKSGDWIRLRDNITTIYRDFKPNQAYKVVYEGMEGRILVEIDSPYTKDKLSLIYSDNFVLDIQYMRQHKINQILTK